MMDKPWWKEDKSIVHERVVKTFQQIDALQIGRMQKYAYFLSLYEGKQITNIDNYTIELNNSDLYNQESKENIVRPAVDSLTAKISTNTPRMITQTNGADFKLKQKAEDRTLLVEGVMNDQKGYKKGRQVFRDGCIWDFGGMKVFHDSDEARVRLERLLAHEIVVDEDEGRYGTPRNMYLIRLYPKEVLQAIYKKPHAIQDAGLVRDYGGVKFAGNPGEFCAVIEAYHLPSRRGASDGKMVVCTDRGVLYTKQWKRDCFPVALWRWKTRQIGYRGFGAVEDIENYQKQLDFLDDKIAKLLNAMTVRIGCSTASQVNPDELTNETMGFPVFNFSGDPPMFFADPGPGPELFAERERKKQAAFEQLGISLLLAQSKKPSGLNAGVAIREYKDTESERFKDVGQSWDEFYVELAELILESLEDLNEDVPNCKIQVPTGGELKDIVLSKIDWDRNKYKIAIRPAGLLPREPAGRLQTINDLMAMFPESQAALAEELNAPDVDNAMEMVSAPIKHIRADIQAMIDGEPRTPEPFVDLNLGIRVTLSYYQKLRAQKNVPEEILEYLRDYMLKCKDILDQQQAAMMNAQQQLAPSGPPQPPVGPGGPPIPGGVQ